MGLTFNATALVAEGVDLKTAQTRLGHSDPRLTLQVYARATTEGDRSAADSLTNRLMAQRSSECAIGFSANQEAQQAHHS